MNIEAGLGSASHTRFGVTDDEYYFTPDDDDDYYVYEYTTAATEEEDMTAGRGATWQEVPIRAEEQARELASEEARNEGTPVTVTGKGASKEDDRHGRKVSK
jgi:hypothetical protein